MAVISTCASLKNGQDASCEAPVRRYFQQVNLINLTDIDPASIVVTTPTEAVPECAYNVQFSLKEGKTGYLYKGPETGSSYKGYFDKSTSDLGFVQYKHNLQMLLVGISEEAKCTLDALSKSKVVAAIQFTDGTVEIYGIRNGLTTVDFTYDVQEGGGGAAIVLSSLDTAPENLVPLVYKSLVEGGENADFDANFANPTPSV